MTKKQLPQRGQIIKITKRKCAETLQPSIKVGNMYVVAGTDKTKTGADVVITLDLVRSKAKHKEETRRCNAERFDWQIYTREQAAEERLRQKAADATEKLLHSFTFEEHMQITFVPLIITHCAWVYAEKVTNYCIEHRLDKAKKLTRTVKELKKQYEKELRKDLTEKLYESVISTGDTFIRDTAFHFLTMECSVRNELMKVSPSEDEHRDIQVFANVVMLMCEYYVEHNKICDLKVQSKLGEMQNTTTNPKITELSELMKEYAKGTKLEKDKHMRTAMGVFANDLKKVKFGPAHKERIAQ